MQFLAITLRRFGLGLGLLLAVLVLNFLLMHLAPGDVADTIAQDAGGLDAEVMAQIRKDYGLDLPLWQQMLKYFYSVVQLDLGYSFYYNQPVTTLILEKLPATLLLIISAQVVSILIGVVFGVIAARNPNGLASHFVTILSLVGYAAPVFWTGIMLIILFASMIPLFPIGKNRVRVHDRCITSPGVTHVDARFNFYRTLQSLGAGQHAGRSGIRLRSYCTGQGAF